MTKTIFVAEVTFKSLLYKLFIPDNEQSVFNLSWVKNFPVNFANSTYPTMMTLYLYVIYAASGATGAV